MPNNVTVQARKKKPFYNQQYVLQPTSKLSSMLFLPTDKPSVLSKLWERIFLHRHLGVRCCSYPSIWIQKIKSTICSIVATIGNIIRSDNVMKTKSTVPRHSWIFNRHLIVFRTEDCCSKQKKNCFIPYY